MTEKITMKHLLRAADRAAAAGDEEVLEKSLRLIEELGNGIESEELQSMQKTDSTLRSCFSRIPAHSPH